MSGFIHDLSKCRDFNKRPQKRQNQLEIIEYLEPVRTDLLNQNYVKNVPLHIFYISFVSLKNTNLVFKIEYSAKFITKCN